MSTPSPLIEEASWKLEKYDFTGAREAYRAVALHTPPTRATLGNLSIVEDQERLQFRRMLSQQYPESVEARLSEAEVLLAIHRPAHAVRLCTELLKTSSTDPKHTLPIRLRRFQAAVHSGDDHVLREDFTAIWLAGDTLPPARRFRARLLHSLAGLEDPRAMSTLETLAEQAWLPLRVQQFFAVKVKELQCLATAIQEP